MYRFYIVFRKSLGYQNNIQWTICLADQRENAVTQLQQTSWIMKTNDAINLIFNHELFTNEFVQNSNDARNLHNGTSQQARVSGNHSARIAHDLPVLSGAIYQILVLSTCEPG